LKINPEGNPANPVQGAYITVEGVVQGVGFRPFIHRLAKTHDLKGFVSNTTTGVHIEVDGNTEKINCFYNDIEKNAPSAAQIQNKTLSLTIPGNHKTFEVRKSFTSSETLTLISPDLSICDDCKEELLDPKNFRYHYPFINCTNCGPRFTIIDELPYDRPLTAMSPFQMCEKCTGEYEDIEDRRYHAQPNACPACGPDITLIKCNDRKVNEALHSGYVAVKKAISFLKEGKIVAVKGIGGFHLACNAENDSAVQKLKERKHREKDKPLAVMMSSVESVRDYCILENSEENLLTGTQKPIVLLEKKPSCSVSDFVTPNNRKLGVMLPYTPLHYLLFEDTSSITSPRFPALVMTSANTSEEPIVKDNDEAVEKLSQIADYILTHNRDILKSCDDSVIQNVNDNVSFIRRSRGYTPFPVVHQFKLDPVLACGAEQKNTFCLTKSNYAFMSQHIGDLKNWETYKQYKENIEHFKNNFQITPEIIACDFHPDYLSTRFAEDYINDNLNGDKTHLFKIQHHHAHIASCMAENGIDEKVIGIAFDGTGYGTDGMIWGGEFLVCDYNNFDRAAHLDYVPLAGGNSAIKEPWKMAVSYLCSTFGDEYKTLELDLLKSIDKDKVEILEEIIKKNINVVQTSSMGRLFDAVSAILLSNTHVSYEGQGAVELEQTIARRDDKHYQFSFIEKDDKLIIDYRPVIKEIVKEIIAKKDVSEIACRFHNTIIHMVVETCNLLSKKTGILKVALSGGCFQNRYLTEGVNKTLEKSGLTCLTHTKVPPNDGGISLGQAIIANERNKHVCRNSC